MLPLVQPLWRRSLRSFAKFEVLFGDGAGVFAHFGRAADDLRQVGEAGAQVATDRRHLRIGRG